MKRVIIESPFRDSPERALTFARAVALACVHKGESAWGSHMIWPQFLPETPEERALGIEAGHAWGEVADIHAFYTDLGWSGGMISALSLCLLKGWYFELRTLRPMPVALPIEGDFTYDDMMTIERSVRENYHGQDY